MEEFSIKELEKIISDGDFDSLIGKIENDFFDCKSQIYDLKNEYSKRELAKDVSSFANLNGGYILIGLKTDDSETYFGEEIKEISLIDKNLVDTEQYNSVINEWIHPKVDAVQIKWITRKEGDKGILIIKVPPQGENQKPFLIRKVVEEKKNTEIIFGYSKRKQDKSESLKIEDIHRAVRDGLLYDKNIENRFNNLESIIQPFLRKRREEEQKNKDRDIINNRVNEILQSYGK
ncbi:MAG: ATP-binding protein [Candidatus Falkowbacteria bacterium]